MTPDALASAGRLLFGGQWQSPLARALGVNRRTIQRWLSGTETPRDPDYIQARLRALLKARRDGIREHLRA